VPPEQPVPARPVTNPGPLRTPIEPRREPVPQDGRPAAAELPPGFGQRLRDLDPQALERFYDVYFDRVYGYVRRLVGEDSLAEDVTQDVFLHLQRSFRSYDPARELSPWVFTIATNKVRDHWRSRRHRDALAERTLDDEEARWEPAARDGGPLPALENDELATQLGRAIEALPESMRAALVLRWDEGLSFEEIARVLGRNEVAVRKRYSRALEELRRSLSKTLGLGGGRA
jgi:RNA polymerase sigma-70 factor (ECF subfamily)